MSPQQAKISLGMALGAIYAIGVLWAGATQVEMNDPGTSQRIAFVAQWLLLPGLVLFACVLKIAKDRFFSESLIDGQKPDRVAPWISIAGFCKTLWNKWCLPSLAGWRWRCSCRRNN